MYKTVSKCRLCGGAELQSAFNLGVQHLTGVFPKSVDEPITAGPVELVKCMAAGGCGLVQLRQSYNSEEMYGANYGYRSGLNPSMVRHLASKVEAILKTGVLRDGDVVVDIGSNDGTTLRAYPQGKYELVGIDPTGVKFAQYYPASIRLIPEFFSADAIAQALGGRKAKVITSFSMFYDLEDPTAFAREIHGALDDEGMWVCEQSYLPAMLDTNSFDTICHEHLEFYTLKQVQWVAEKVGLRLIDVEFNAVNGGSFSFAAVKAGSTRTGRPEVVAQALAHEVSHGLDGMTVFTDFQARVQDARKNLVAFLHQAAADNKRVYGIGASTKGNVLLQYFGIGPALLPQIGEVNPDKFGAFTPGTHIPLVPEDAVLASNPDYLLVFPWHFRDFFLSNPKFKGRTLVFPLPALEVVVAGGV